MIIHVLSEKDHIEDEINDLKFHDLRHTFASHLVMAGVDLTIAKGALRPQVINNDYEVCAFIIRLQKKSGRYT